jgi:hypothetical protein
MVKPVLRVNRRPSTPVFIIFFLANLLLLPLG